MGHLFRAGALLIAVLLFVFVGLRILPVPEALTDFGFHSRDSEKNRELWAGLPMQFASSSICVNCHEDNYNLWEKGNHRAVSCENCHGAAVTHLATGEPPAVSHNTRELCGTCHSQLVSRPASFPQVNMSEMGGGAECVTCHDPHEPRAGMPPEVPHHLDDRTDCQSCHSPEEPLETLPPQTPHTLEGRADCLSCHGPSGIRGAALPHPPHSLEGRSDCLLCHNVGGIRPLPEDHAGRKSTTCLNCHRSE
ncbi:MAG: cytochrome c3 family protein [Dehalococcoidales bacterium]|nr:cytochrome c3 family protein [Dehalococcoidales bacterium]